MQQLTTWTTLLCKSKIYVSVLNLFLFYFWTALYTIWNSHNGLTNLTYICYKISAKHWDMIALLIANEFQILQNHAFHANKHVCFNMHHIYCICYICTMHVFYTIYAWSMVCTIHVWYNFAYHILVWYDHAHIISYVYLITSWLLASLRSIISCMPVIFRPVLIQSNIFIYYYDCLHLPCMIDARVPHPLF